MNYRGGRFVEGLQLELIITKLYTIEFADSRD